MKWSDKSYWPVGGFYSLFMMFFYYIIIFALAAPLGFSQLSDPSQIAHASFEDLARGYLGWMHLHPSVIKSGTPLKLPMPSIDLYSPSGVSIYHGTDSSKNSIFISELPQNIRKARTEEVRPTLKEALDMIPELRSREAGFLRGGGYTVFAVSYTDWDEAKAQEQAVQALRQRARRIGIQVVEVELRR